MVIRLLEDRSTSGSSPSVSETSQWSRAPGLVSASRRLQVPTVSEDLEQEAEATVFRAATTRSELHAAMRLVHDNYVHLGLIKPNKRRMHVIPQHALPTTEVYVAVRAGEVIATLTIIRDSGYGLPMESVYPDEVEAFRQRGLCVAEVGCLADKQDEVAGMTGALFRLMAVAAQRCSRLGVDVPLVVCHPRHGKFYERFLGFEQIGEEKPYEKVCGRPAVALALDLHGLGEHHPRGHQRLFGEAFPEETVCPDQAPAQLLDELRAIVEENQVAGHRLQVAGSGPGGVASTHGRTGIRRSRAASAWRQKSRRGCVGRSALAAR